jgi:ribosomal protein L40E
MAEPHRPTPGLDRHEEDDIHTADETERLLGRTIAIGLPVAFITSAVIVGFVASVGSALLVAAAGALLGTIALLWTSLRTLSGDAPLPSGFDDVATQRDGVDTLAEDKRRALRALKDLENERALGRIDDADYETFQNRYREEAKDLMRRIDERTAPSRAEAERVASEYIARRTRSRATTGEARPDDRGAKPVELNVRAETEANRTERVSCAKCGASNESDATFCKQCGAGIGKSTDYINARA